MKTVLIEENKPQYKANLHCHSVLSDGRLTPEQLKEVYKAHGYSVLAITDHERTCDHSALSDPGFLMLTGYEMYIRPGNRYDEFGQEIHMNLFARDPHNVGMINYNPDVARYTPPEEKERVTLLGRQEPRQYSAGYINRTIETAKQNGYIVAYNHPYWSHEDIRDVISYRGFFSMEMCNYSSWVENLLEYNGQLYDELLREGVRIACHSADDNHNHAPFDSPRNDSFGGFTFILAEELNYDSVFRALEEQRFYSSMGPEILSLTVDGNTVRVKTSPVNRIFMYCGRKSPRMVLSEDGSDVTEAEFKIPERADHFRISAVDSRMRFADTRGYFRDEWS
ncbi:MAG: PHP domain-containing protein [Clostridia bacterium]|nr:PHP domain-containing protein [Clostridia bacterium]